MRNKLIYLLTALLIIMSLLAGCQGSSGPGGGNDEGNIVLKYWTHLETPWNISNDKLIAAFEEEFPHIKIDVEAFPYDDFEQKVQTSLLSKSGGADIYELWGGWAYEYSNTGVFSPVPDELIGDLIDDCYAPVLGAFEYNGSYYGVPMEFNAEYGGMLINKPYFDENNLTVPATWDDMIALAAEHSVSKGDIFDMRGLDFISFDTLPYTWLSMILSSGGNYLEGDTFNFDTDIAKETLQKLVDYVKVDKVTNIEALLGSELENHDQLFLGEALMAPRGIWTIPSGDEDYGLEYGVDFSYAAMPFYGDKKLWAAETGWGLAVNAGSEYEEAAWEFVSFCLRPENLLGLNIDRGMIPPRKSVAHKQEFVDAVPFAKPILDVLDGASFIGPINTDILKESICAMFADIVQNNTPIDEAVAALNENIK